MTTPLIDAVTARLAEVVRRHGTVVTLSPWDLADVLSTVERLADEKQQAQESDIHHMEEIDRLRARINDLERLERAVVDWCHCRVTGQDHVQLACDHDRTLAAAARTAYRREHPTE